VSCLSKYKKTGGPELAVLQETSCSLVIELITTSEAGQVYDQIRHCVAFDGQRIFDNEVGFFEIEDSDRHDKDKARKVFNALYKGYKRVDISNVYVLCPCLDGCE
jgi:hypothetical protein